MSQGALALVIVGDVDCTLATVQVQKVRFRAKLLASGEPLLLNGTLAQIGNQWVDKFVPCTTPVDVADSCVARLAVYRDACPIPWPATRLAVSARNGTAFQILDNPQLCLRRGEGIFTIPRSNLFPPQLPPPSKCSSGFLRSSNCRCKLTLGEGGLYHVCALLACPLHGNVRSAPRASGPGHGDDKSNALALDRSALKRGSLQRLGGVFQAVGRCRRELIRLGGIGSGETSCTMLLRTCKSLLPNRPQREGGTRKEPWGKGIRTHTWLAASHRE